MIGGAKMLSDQMEIFDKLIKEAEKSGDVKRVKKLKIMRSIVFFSMSLIA